MTESIFGPLVSPWTLRRQIVTIYRVWCSEYLAEIERKEGLSNRIIPRPPAADSIHGALDFTDWQGFELPAIRVVVQPAGKPERDASTGYEQIYEIEIGCICLGLGASEIANPSISPKEEAEAFASYYGAMSMLLVDQVPTLVSQIEMVETPRLSWPNSDSRTICLSTTSFHAMVAPVKLLSAGPTQPNPAESPLYGGEPEGKWGEEPDVRSHTVTVTDTHPL